MSTKKDKVLTSKDINKLFISGMKKLAVALDKPESEITLAEFLANVPNELTEWNLRSVGGFTNLKKLYFPADEQIEVKSGAKIIQAHRAKLEDKYGTAIFLKNEFLTLIREQFEKNPPKVHKPVATVKDTKKKKRVLLSHLSDLHLGCKFDKAEMAGINEWNWTIASRRLAYLMEQIVAYKADHRAETELVIGLNGDVIAGMIHNQEYFVDLLTTQFSGGLSLLTQAFSYVAQYFSKVTIYCTVGNHGRAMHKGDKGRSSVNKWDAYENMLYVALREALKNHKNVTVNIPESPFAIYKIFNHSIFQTHGDSDFEVGNPEKGVNIKNINAMVSDLNASKLANNENFKVILLGHLHTPLFYLTNSGCTLFINGSLMGTDPFAQSIGIYKSFPAQWIFEVTEARAVGDQRLVMLDEADVMESLDKIVEPFKRKF